MSPNAGDACNSSAEQDGDVDARWEEIKEEDDNMLLKLERSRLRQKFFDYLESRATEIEGIVSQHLSLQSPQQCNVPDQSKWLSGDFNACIPVSISHWQAKRVLVRCPFPHMLGLHGSDNIDEKIRCEAATLAWIPKNCPRVPVPHIWGFGLPNGLCFTARAHLPLYLRAFERLKDLWAWLRREPRCCPFTPRPSPFSLKSGYLVVDFIEKEQGIVLSSAWPPKSTIQKRNFYRGLARVILDLSRCPLPRIGSFTVNNVGEISLTNRPLTLRLPLLENEGIPTNIPRDRCFSNTDSYLRALLHCLDLRLRYQPNAIRNQYDARFQMAILTILRSILTDYTQPDLQDGPFYFTFTDFNPGNLMIDGQYKLSSIIDPEWCCALPAEMWHPPFWLSGYAADDLEGDKEGFFEDMCKEFLNILEEEEMALGSCTYTNTIRVALAMKSHWFWACLREPRATCRIFFDHLRPRYLPVHSEEEEEAAALETDEDEDNRQIQFQRTVASYFTVHGSGFLKQKLLDRDYYINRLRLQYRIQYL